MMTLYRLTRSFRGLTGFFLQFLGKGNEVNKAATGDCDVLVELGESGGLERGREGTAQGPHAFAALGGGGKFHLEGFVLCKEGLKSLAFAQDTSPLAVEFD